MYLNFLNIQKSKNFKQMKKALIIILVFGFAFIAAWLLLKQNKSVVAAVKPEQTEDENEVYSLAPEGSAVYEGSMINSSVVSSPTSSTSSTSTATTSSRSVTSSSGRRTTSSFTFWHEKPETSFV